MINKSSIRHRFALALSISILLSLNLLGDQLKYMADDVLVTSTRIPTSHFDINRNITIMSSEEISRLPVQSVQELLDHVPGIDLKTRGRHGVQADLSIRGSSFEQTLVLIDGVKINDPQTGHHNLNIPLDPGDIQRIEILKGGGSSLYGPGAFGGIVNIITKRNENKKMKLYLAGGDHEFANGALSVVYPLGNTYNRISISQKHSGGYTEATNFDITKVRYASNLILNSFETGISASYQDKEFGANRFYSDNFPDEWEHTKTLFLGAKALKHLDNTDISLGLNWRNHHDDFILDKARPDWYRNKHETNSYSAEFEMRFNSAFGKTAIGAEFASEKIESYSLGNHIRTRGGMFLEHQAVIFKYLTWQLGSFIYKHENDNANIWPSLSVGYQISGKSKIYASTGKSYRVPTFTELYYTSPANVGNPELKHEKALTYEVGFKYSCGYLVGNISGFRREGNNLIDWVRQSPDSAWQVRNVSEINTKGFELSVIIFPEFINNSLPVKSLNCSYTFLDSDKTSNNFESKYGLNLVEHQLLLGTDLSLPLGISQTWSIRYESPLNGDSRTITDSKLSLQLEKLTWFIETSNLFDFRYTEIGSIPMPGRQVIAGLSYRVF